MSAALAHHSDAQRAAAAAGIAANAVLRQGKSAAGAVAAARRTARAQAGAA